MRELEGFRLASVEEAAAEFRRGRFVIIVDDEDRENEGDLVIAAERVTPEAINFMAMHGRGLICLPATTERLRELELEMMVDRNTALQALLLDPTITLISQAEAVLDELLEVHADLLPQFK